MSRHRKNNARRRPLPRWRLTGSSEGLRALGPYVTSGISGWLLERRKAVKQRGVWVSAEFRDGERDVDE